jgi:hypothetical protein
MENVLPCDVFFLSFHSLYFHIAAFHNFHLNAREKLGQTSVSNDSLSSDVVMRFLGAP